MSFLSTKLEALSDDIELEDPTYTGKYEVKITFYFLLLYGFWQILRFNATYSLFENIANAVLDTLAFSPVLLIATLPIDSWFKKKIKKSNGLEIFLFFTAIYVVYFSIGIPFQFQRTQTYVQGIENFLFPSNFFLNFLFLLLCVFFFFRFPFYLLELREEDLGPFGIFKNIKKYKWIHIHFIIICVLGVFSVYGLLRESYGTIALILGLLIIPIFFILLLVSQFSPLKYNIGREEDDKVLTFSDFFCMLFMAPSLLYIYMLPFTGSWGIFLFLVLIIYGTEIGREHYYYSYVPESAHDVYDYVDMILISFLIFIPLAVLVGFIDLNNFTVDVNFPELYGAFCMWTFYVGIAEEVLFRCALLVLFSDLFKVKGVKRHKTWALVISSVLFGLGHAPKGWNYCLLAIIAGFAYGLLFLKGRNMFGPIMLHMTIDVVAAKFFGAQL